MSANTNADVAAMVDAISQRFWSKVDKSDGCWTWMGTKCPKGYGSMGVGGKVKRATHVSVWLTSGAWPAADLIVCHHCDNPSCVRPEHLFVGTQKENMQDCVRKGRNRSPKIPSEVKPRGERHGLSKLTAEQVREIRTSTETHRVLADRHGVNRRRIWEIRQGVTWRHVA